MNRRNLLKNASMGIAAFAMSRDAFASQVILPENAEEIIKLSSNENPYGPSPKAKKAMMEAINTSNRYQWNQSMELRKELAKLTSHTEKNIIIGAGSSDLLGIICLLAAEKSGNVVAPYPTFRLWMDAAQTMGLKTKSVPVTDQKDTDLKGMQAAIDSETRMIYLCNPNNPTGVPIPDADLRAFVKNTPSHIWILLDEAYTEFEDTPSLSDMVNDYPNLIITKTFSKIYGMAGCRVGYAVAHENTIHKLVALQPWANAAPGAVSVAGALACLQDREFINFVKKENSKCRDLFLKTLDELGLPYAKSVTSFVYFNSEKYPRDLAKYLQENKIVGARTFENGTKWLRLSIGTETEMKRVSEVLKA